VFFASTKLALETLEHYCRVDLKKRQAREGTLLAVRAGEIARRTRFTPQRFVETDPLPAVRAPGERENCPMRLSALAAA